MLQNPKVKIVVLVKTGLNNYLSSLGCMLEKFPMKLEKKSINIRGRPFISALRLIASQVCAIYCTSKTL